MDSDGLGPLRKLTTHNIDPALPVSAKLIAELRNMFMNPSDPRFDVGQAISLLVTAVMELEIELAERVGG